MVFIFKQREIKIYGDNFIRNLMKLSVYLEKRCIEFRYDIIEYGLNNISDKEKITMSLKDFLYIRRVLEEYMRYLHNPDHYPDIEAIQNFLGDISSGGGFECLSTAIYKKVYKVDLPSKIEKMIDDGVFEHPLYPSYYKENE